MFGGAGRGPGPGLGLRSGSAAAGVATCRSLGTEATAGESPQRELSDLPAGVPCRGSQPRRGHFQVLLPSLPAAEMVCLLPARAPRDRDRSPRFSV